ncbi:periplasmic binding protein-like II [Piromyces finnis]|uniref:Periplasmic binding protein-like II n=1 Tax=Piromyces finnis TaxID=1754191 RepID=A0A1Y1VKX1_9FUNG|nr:periplasmic binding protein-like II [Piromyces finnis]|eukprot:ORX59082.1 periplasmic binding protein-like II [Piromyces finnis]
MNLFTYLTFIFLFILDFIYCTTIEIIYHADGYNEKIINKIIDDFNDESRGKGWDVTLSKNTISTDLTSDSYTESLESLLKSNRKSDIYDIIIYDVGEKNRFSKHLEDLDKYLDTSIIDQYTQGIVGDILLFDNKLYSIPLYLEYSMLYYNTELLDKYEKEVPKTWSDLYNITNYIVSEEKSKGRNIIGYSSEMADTETGFCSFYEYAYSFRNLPTDSYPSFKNPEGRNSVEFLMKMKNELGDSAFYSDYKSINYCLKSSTCLFVKTWNNVEHDNRFGMTTLPGKNKDVSGSIISGYNIGINNKISKEKKELASIVLNYFSSKDFQKNIIMEAGYLSGYKELYEDNTECEKYSQCQTLKSVQYLLKPTDLTEDYTNYSKKFRNYLLQYLTNGDDIMEYLISIESLSNVLFEDKNFIVNKIIINVICATNLFFLCSLAVAHTKKHIKKFRIFKCFYWFFYLLGLMLIMGYAFTGIGRLNNFKCRIRTFLLSIGFTLSNTLLCIRMLINFPESERRFVRFCERHIGLCVHLSVFIDTILNFLVYIDPYKVVILTDDNIRYYSCQIQGNLGHGLLGLIYIYKIIIILALFLLVFIEWNMEEYKNDIRLVLGNIICCTITFAIYAIMQLLNINSQFRFMIISFLSYLFGVSNFCIFFFSRFFFGETEEEVENKIILEKAKNRSKSLASTGLERYRSSISLNQSGSGPGKKMSFTERIVSLHNFGEEIKKSCDISKKSNSSSSNDVSSSKDNIKNAFGSKDNLKSMSGSKDNLKSMSGSKDNLKKISHSSINISLGRLDEEAPSIQRKASQIDVIPENKIAEIYNSTNDRISENIDDVYISRSRTRSYDNVLSNMNRVTRINSTPNKKYIGSSNMRSYENFSSNRFVRKGSNVSFSNINATTTTTSYNNNNLPSDNSNSNISKKDIAVSNSVDNIEIITHNGKSQNNISSGVPYNVISGDFVSINSSNYKNSIYEDTSSTYSDNNKSNNNNRGNGLPSALSMNSHVSFRSAEDSNFDA